MISGGSDEVESEVVPPCPMLWLDEVRNAVEYVACPWHQWAGQASQSVSNRLNCSAAAREENGGVSLKFNATGNNFVEDYVPEVFDLITQVDTADETSCQAAQLNSGFIVDTLDSDELIVDKLDSNEDDRPACVNVESIDDIRSDLSELLHLELTKDTNDGDRVTTQNVIGIDHLSQEVDPPALQNQELQDLSVSLSVSKTDTCRKSSTNLHMEMDIAACAVNVHMLIDEQERGHLMPDQHLALDVRYSKSLGDLKHQPSIPSSEVVPSDGCKPVVEISEEGMLFDSKVPSEQVGLSNVKVKVHAQEPPNEGKSRLCHEKKPLACSGLVNPGFVPEDDDDEAVYMAKQLSNGYPVEVWSQESPHAYNYDSGLPEIKIDDDYCDLGDTNEDIRDLRCGDNTVEEIDPLVTIEVEGADRKGCEVDTNEDMRPVYENMAAFDHLSSEVTGEKPIETHKSNTQVDCGLRVSDVNLHFSVSNNSLKIDFALKSPDGACSSEDRRSENLHVVQCSSYVMKTEERNQIAGALKAHCLSCVKGCRDQAIPYEFLTDVEQHLYSDEPYVNTQGQDGNACRAKLFPGCTQPTVSDSGEISLHYGFSPYHNRHNNAIEGLENGSPPAVFESHECTSCQNFMLSNRQGTLPSTADEIGGMSCGARNKKTITRSTHLDCPGMALEADIHVEKTLIAPSISELGELSSAICTYDIPSASAICTHDIPSASAICTHDIPSTSGSHGIAANENEDGANAHASEWIDLAAWASSCFDTVFWVCLVVVVILFEVYKCFWLFLLPSCLFILSVLVSDNPKPSD